MLPPGLHESGCVFCAANRGHRVIWVKLLTRAYLCRTGHRGVCQNLRWQQGSLAQKTGRGGGGTVCVEKRPPAVGDKVDPLTAERAALQGHEV